MSEPKGRVDFSLDNRQVFFLFFGLSVVGCFVFALGVMVGRDDLGGLGSAQPASAQGPTQGPSLLEEEEAGLLAIAPADSFAFKDGIAEPATQDLPSTRDPAVPPRDEKLLKAERGLDKNGKKIGGKKDAPPVVVAKVEPRVEPPLAKTDPKPEPEPTPAPSKVEDKPAPSAPESPSKSDDGAVMANGAGEAADARQAKAKRHYTLQLKAFTSNDDADKMADKLRRNGHEVRVEEADVQGRIWHRVRIGDFTNWDKAIEAKAAFEKQEQVIAYVVPM
ncbi:MAG: SPOR domain-containing protein [Nannocystaceae bacterium]